MSDILNQVRQAVDSGEVTVTELAARVGKTRQTVYRWLNGEIDPPYSCVLDLVAALGECRERIEGEAALKTGEEQHGVGRGQDRDLEAGDAGTDGAGRGAGCSGGAGGSSPVLRAGAGQVREGGNGKDEGGRMKDEGAKKQETAGTAALPSKHSKPAGGGVGVVG